MQRLSILRLDSELVKYVYMSNTFNWHSRCSSRHLVSAQQRPQQTDNQSVCPLSGGAGRHLAGANLHVLNSLCQHPYTQSGGAIFTSVRDGCALKLGRAITESVGLATVTNTSWPLERERQRHLHCLLKTLSRRGKKTRPSNIT